MGTSVTDLVDRSQDVQILIDAIAEQEQTIKRLEETRAALPAESPIVDQDEADLRVLQAYDYLSELRGDLEGALQTPIVPALPADDSLGAEDPSGPDGLAIVIGHSPRGDKGAVGLSPPLPDRADDGRSEYYWNRELAGWIKEELTRVNLSCEIFHRFRNEGPGIRDAYREVIRWQPKATIELHFNSHTGTAEGSETLYQLSGSKSWAQKLQSAMVALYGHAGRLSARGAKLDRGIKLASEAGRGRLNVSLIAPSALIEPFFGDNLTDATRGVTKKRELARAIAQAYVEFAGASVSLGTGPVVGPSEPTIPITATLWERLRDIYSRARIDFPHLKQITYAQWALESGFGTSELAQQHLNFGGMKFRDFLSDIATPVLYKGDNYCKFRSLEDFIAGYWRRFDAIPAYAGWRQHTETQLSYLTFIAPIYAPPSENPNYVPKILSLYDRLKAQGALPVITLGPSEPNNPVQVVGDLAHRVSQVAPSDASNFIELVRAYADRLVPHPELKLASIAQWALESNWGRSDLAKIHYNFAGMEWHDAMKDLAAPVDYQRGDGVVGKYCRFVSLGAFCDGYWQRFSLDGRFAELANHVSSADDFLQHISPILRPGDGSYAAKVLNILSRIQSTPVISAGTGTQPDSGESGSTAPIEDGFVIHIRRSHTEQRRGRKYRTVGRYEVFFNGQKLPSLEGMTFETWGPGDNSPRGKRNQVRVEAKTYPLFTHFGSKTVPDANGVRKVAFVTHGFTSDERTRMPSMPSIRLGTTGERTGVLFHPAEGWIWSVGCLHLSTPLNGPSSNINYKDSRARVIALMDAMKAKLGTDFPAENNRLIPGAKLVIEGEPVPGGEAMSDAAEFDAIEPDGVTEDPNFLSDEEAFDAIAATMNAMISPLAISHTRFAQLLAQRSDILSLRGDVGQNLWSEWAGGWQASFRVGEATKAFIQGELAKIAEALSTAGLSVNDDAGLLTPLTTAAAADEFHAVTALHERGARLDQRNRQGNTPLAVAAFSGAVESVRVLLALGADRAVKTAGMDAPSMDVALNAAADDFRGAIDAPLWTQDYAETCPSGSTPLECADAGRRLSEGEADREAAYDAILAMLRV